IARRLAGVVFGGGAEPPAFGVVAPTEDGTVILLRGNVCARVHGAEGPRALSGARAFTWVDEIVREPVRRISVGDDNGRPPAVHPATDLRAGIVTGSGFELRVGVRRAGSPREGGTTGDGADGAAPGSDGPAPAGSGAESIPAATATATAASSPAASSPAASSPAAVAARPAGQAPRPSGASGGIAASAPRNGGAAASPAVADPSAPDSAPS